jgi:hypothetical protein
MIIGSMTLLSIQFSLQYSFSIFTTIKQKETPVVYETDKIANLHGYEVLITLV